MNKEDNIVSTKPRLFWCHLSSTILFVFTNNSLRKSIIRPMTVLHPRISYRYVWNWSKSEIYEWNTRPSIKQVKQRRVLVFWFVCSISGATVFNFWIVPYLLSRKCSYLILKRSFMMHDAAATAVFCVLAASSSITRMMYLPFRALLSVTIDVMVLYLHALASINL